MQKELSGQLEIRDILQSASIVDFIEWLFASHSNISCINGMLGTIEMWADLSKNEFLEIIRRIGENEVALFHFLSFMGKYIGVDFRGDLAGVSAKARSFVLSGLGESKSPLFYFDDRFDNEVLERLHVSREILFEIRGRLLREGVATAKAVKPNELRI